MTRATPLDLGTLEQVAGALTDIATVAEAELQWSDHGCDTALRRIEADAVGALERLGFSLPERAGLRPRLAPSG